MAVRSFACSGVDDEANERKRGTHPLLGDMSHLFYFKGRSYSFFFLPTVLGPASGAISNRTCSGASNIRQRGHPFQRHGPLQGGRQWQYRSSNEPGKSLRPGSPTFSHEGAAINNGSNSKSLQRLIFLFLSSPLFPSSPVLVSARFSKENGLESIRQRKPSLHLHLMAWIVTSAV